MRIRKELSEPEFKRVRLDNGEKRTLGICFANHASVYSLASGDVTEGTAMGIRLRVNDVRSST